MGLLLRKQFELDTILAIELGLGLLHLRAQPLPALRAGRGTTVRKLLAALHIPFVLLG